MHKLLTIMLFTLCACPGGCQSTNEKPSTAQNVPSPEARLTDPLYAYVDSARADLSQGKVQIINKVMRLSPAEAKVFWPIYHDYEEELFDLGDQRVELTRAFVKAQISKTLDNDKAQALADNWFKLENQRLDLLQKYHRQIAEDLSPLRAAQFVQIENRMGTMVDLMIASELPIVQVKPAK